MTGKKGTTEWGRSGVPRRWLRACAGQLPQGHTTLLSASLVSCLSSPAQATDQESEQNEVHLGARGGDCSVVTLTKIRRLKRGTVLF